MQVAQSLIVVAARVNRHSNVAPASLVNDHAGAVALPGEVGAAPIAGAAGAVVS